MIVPQRRQRSVSTRYLAFASFGSPGDEYRAVMAEFQVKGLSPGFALFVESVDFMLVDVHAVNATPHEDVLMGVEWLDDLLAPLVIHQGGQEGVGLFALLITSPSGVSLGTTVMNVCGEVPIASDH